MRKLIALSLALMIPLSMVGCSKGQGHPIVAYIGEDITKVEVMHYIGGQESQWTATGNDVDSLRGWVSAQEYELVEFEEGQSPGDSDGGEVYDFILTESDYPGFSYVISGADECYLLIKSHWYSVANPSNPPIED